jgi:L-serine/L-threonine ammonia-lyase
MDGCVVLVEEDYSAVSYNSKPKMITVETKGAESLNASLVAAKLITLPGITSIATSLGAVTVAQHAFDLAKAGEDEGRVQSLVVSDEEAIRACVEFAGMYQMLVEPACGASLAVVQGLGKRMGLGEEGKIVVVVCGGRNVGVEIMSEWMKMYGIA